MKARHPIKSGDSESFLRRRAERPDKDLAALLEHPNVIRAFARLEGRRRVRPGTVCRLVTGVERPQSRLPENLTDETYSVVLFGEDGKVRRQVKRFVLPAAHRRASTEFAMIFDHAGQYTVLVDLLYGIDFVCQVSVKIRVDAPPQISHLA